MQTVSGEDEENQEVRNHHGQVESVGMIDAAESAVGKPVPVMAQRILLDEQE